MFGLFSITGLLEIQKMRKYYFLTKVNWNYSELKSAPRLSNIKQVTSFLVSIYNKKY